MTPHELLREAQTSDEVLDALRSLYDEVGFMALSQYIIEHVDMLNPDWVQGFAAAFNLLSLYAGRIEPMALKIASDKTLLLITGIFEKEQQRRQYEQARIMTEVQNTLDLSELFEDESERAHDTS